MASDLRITVRDEVEANRPSRTFELSDKVLQVAARLISSLDPAQQVVLVTGYDGTDGAADLAAQLSIGLARVSQSKIAIIDADTGAPSLNKLLNAPDQPGLAELMTGSSDLDSVVKQFDTGVDLIPAGKATKALTLPDCARVIPELRSRYRYLVIAAGPLLSRVDTVTLATLSDGILLVLREWERNREDVIALQREVARLRKRLLGAVLRERK